jgi:hypothetical protein
LFTSPPPVSKTGLDWGARELRSCPGRIPAGCPKSGPARKFSPGLVTKKKSRDAIQGTKVLCPDNADEVEKILRGVRRTCGAAPSAPRFALMRGSKSSRLHHNTLINNRRRCFVLRLREREVVGDVVSELEEFGGFKGRKTAEQQSDQRDEDELGSHFQARSQAPLIQHQGSQLNGTLDLFAPVMFGGVDNVVEEKRCAAGGRATILSALSGEVAPSVPVRFSLLTCTTVQV